MSVRKVVVPELARLPSFCHAVIAGHTVYVSGTLGTAGPDLQLVDGGAAEQTRQAMANIATILGACGADLSALVKVNVFLADMQDSGAMNRAYLDAVGDDPPARITVGRADLALGAAVEIDAVAYLPGD